jgi:hypothetical protein|tara:strand:+ start:54 stop:563 length:510 start_codon:yes stop_codon:yes gene_type:complete
MNLLKPIFGMFLVILLGAVFIQAIGDNIFPTTSAFTATNETLDFTDARYTVGGGNWSANINDSVQFSLAQNNWTSGSIVITDVNGSAWTEDTDYMVDYTTFRINFSNTTTLYDYGSNESLVSYNYYHANYVADGTSRILLGLIAIFFAIGILMLTIAYFKGFEWAGFGK